MFVVMMSLVEMASRTPSSGAQYQWVSECAPARSQKFLSYAVGWFSTLGWLACITIVTYTCARQFQSLISLSNPTYVPRPWHQSLISVGITLLATLFNTCMVRRLPLIQGLLLMVHVAGFVLIVLILWTMGVRSDVRTTFTEFNDQAGWSSTGLACLVGIASPVVSLIGADSCCQLSEEVRDASWALPKCVLVTSLANYIFTFLMVVTFMFHLGNVDEILDSSFGQAYVTVIYNTTNSHGATVAITAMVTFMLVACAINQLTTSSRQLYAFARDGGVPFSGWLSHVSPAVLPNFPTQQSILTYLPF